LADLSPDIDPAAPATAVLDTLGMHLDFAA
jgi:hypothetical protein